MDGHGNFKFGESFSIHSPPFSKNLLCASYSMGSGEPYQVTRLYLKKINFYAPPTFNPEVHDDIPESFVTWSYWFGLRPNWEAIAQPKQYYIIALGQ